MKSVLLLLCAFALVFAMDLEIRQVSLGAYEYTVKELNAVNTSLQVVVMKEGKQYYVEDFANYDGYQKGRLTLLQPGNYEVTAFNPNTGGTAVSTIAITSPTISEEFRENFSEQQKQAIEEQTRIPVEQIIPGLPYIIVGLFVVLVALIVFGNPLKKK